MLLLRVDISIMILSCSYLGHSGDTVLVLNLKLETKSGGKHRETIYRSNIIRYYLKGN